MNLKNLELTPTERRAFKHITGLRPGQVRRGDFKFTFMSHTRAPRRGRKSLWVKLQSRWWGTPYLQCQR
jgi:hypothetical protein